MTVAIATIKRKRHKWKFQSKKRLGLAVKQTQYKKNIKIRENPKLLIFSTYFRAVNISKKISWPLMSSLWLSFTVLNMFFFSDNVSAVTHFYRCIMAKLWFTEHSGFMKDFRSFTMKNNYLFNVSSIHADLFLFKLAICKFLSIKSSKTQKQLVQMCFLPT